MPILKNQYVRMDKLSVLRRICLRSQNAAPGPPDLGTVRERSFSFLVVLGAGILLFASVVVSTILSVFAKYWDNDVGIRRGRLAGDNSGVGLLLGANHPFGAEFHARVR
jgi:hypothetical protein